MSGPRRSTVELQRAVLQRSARVSLLADQLEDDYEWEVLRGAAEEAAAREAQLVAFVGSELGASRLQNALFELVGPANSDGVVVLGGALVNEVGLGELERFVGRFEGLVVTSVGAELDRCGAVLASELAGVRQAVVHLVQHHGLRRFAFIEGPPHNPEARARRHAVESSLAELGLYLDENLVVPGSFSRESGQGATRWLLEEHGPDDFDVIFACDDYTALGALDALDEAGLACPDDIAVVGFDDLPLGRQHHPALATVRQPLREIGRRAVSQVLEPWDEAPTERLDTQFIPRESCGCRRRWPSEKSSTGMTSVRKKWIAAELNTVVGERLAVLGPEWATELVEALFSDVGALQGDRFKRAFYSYARTLVPLEVDLETLNDILSLLRSHLREVFEPGTDERDMLDGLFDELRMYVTTAVDRAHIRRRVRSDQAMSELRTATGALISSFELEQLAAALTSSLPRLGIRRFYLVVSRERRGQLLLAIDEAHPRGDLPENLVFDPRYLVPPPYLQVDAHPYVVKPLFLGEEPLGYIMLSLGDCPPSSYEVLREQISATVKGAELRRQRDSMVGLLEQVAALRSSLGSPAERQQLAAELDRILDQAAELKRGFSLSPAREFSRKPPSR